MLPDKPFKLILVGKSKTLEIEDNNKIVKNRMMAATRKEWFNFYHDIPHFKSEVISGNVFGWSLG
jgi:hypothetical protein